MSDVERRLQESMAVTTRHLTPSSRLGENAIRIGQGRRRRRLVTTIGLAAAVVLAASTVAILVTRRDHSPQPAISPSPSVSPAPSGAPSPSAPPASASATAPGSWAGSVAFLDGSGVIHTAGGKLVDIDLPSGRTADSATAVTGGWVVTLKRDPLALAEYVFVEEDGASHAFDPPVQSTPAFSPDRRRMVAMVNRELVVFELPSRRVLQRIDASNSGLGQPSRLWLRGDRIVVQHMGLGDAGGPTGVAVWRLAGTVTVSPNVRLYDISDDGSTVLVIRTTGSGPGSRDCLEVTAFTDRFASTGSGFCGPDGNSFPVASFSPDGHWVATIAVAGPNSSEVWVYRVAELRSGTAQPARLRDRYPAQNNPGIEGWVAPHTLVIAGETVPLRWVVSCPVDRETCAPLDLPASPTAVIL